MLQPYIESATSLSDCYIDDEEIQYAGIAITYIFV